MHEQIGLNNSVLFFKKTIVIYLFLLSTILHVNAANRYWVATTGNWSNPANWSSTSGGAGGASAPTIADDVFFDSFSICTIDVNTTVNSLNLFSGGDVTLNFSNKLTVTGNYLVGGANRIYYYGPDTLALEGNLIITNTNSGGGGGNGTLAFTGAGIQNISAPSGLSSGFPNILINCNALNFNGALSFRDTWSHVAGTTANMEVIWFSYSNGVISGVQTFKKLELISVYRTLTFQDSISITDSLILNTSNGSATLDLQSPIGLLGDLLTSGPNRIRYNNNTLHAKRDIYLMNTSLFQGGSGMLRIDGTTDQFIFGTSNGAESSFPDIVIAKSGGTLYLQNTLSTIGDFVHLNGNVDATSLGSTLFIGSNSIRDTLFCSGITLDNLEIGNTSRWSPVYLGENVNVANDFTVLNGAGFHTNGYDMFVGGNFTITPNYAENFYPTSSTITFNGSDPNNIQYVNVNGRALYNVVLNNTANRASADEITLNNLLPISNQLTCSNGRIKTIGDSLVVLEDGASTNIGNYGSYVNGKINYNMAFQGSRILNFPVGKDSIWHYAVLTPHHSSSTSYTYQSYLVNNSAAALPIALPPTISYVSPTRYWEIHRSVTGGAASSADLDSAQITLYYDLSDSISNYTDLSVAKTDLTESNWIDLNGTPTAPITGTITSDGFTSFSKFSFADKLDAPLPTVLISFDAVLKNNHVEVLWTTTSEINSDYFEVQRSFDAKNFNPIGVIQGAGNSTELLYYTFKDYAIDPNQPNTTLYYRLKQVDFDKAFSFSNTVAVSQDNLSLTIGNPFPNPSKNLFYLPIKFNIDSQETIKLMLFNSFGQVVFNKTHQDSSSKNFKLNLTLLPKGVYFLSVFNRKRNLLKKFKLIKN